MNFICHWQHLVQIYNFLRFSIGDVLNLMGKDSVHMQAQWPSLVCGGSDAVIGNIYPVLRNTLHMASILPMRKLRLGDLDDSFWDGQLRFLPPGLEIFFGLFTTCPEIHVFSWILVWASEPLLFLSLCLTSAGASVLLPRVPCLLCQRAILQESWISPGDPWESLVSAVFLILFAFL